MEHNFKDFKRLKYITIVIKNSPFDCGSLSGITLANSLCPLDIRY